jgi:phospholipase/lecithinase/hemolysin
MELGHFHPNRRPHPAHLPIETGIGRLVLIFNGNFCARSAKALVSLLSADGYRMIDRPARRPRERERRILMFWVSRNGDRVTGTNRRRGKMRGNRHRALSSYFRRVRCEALEDRRLLAGVPNFSQMVVFGDSLSDTGNDSGIASLFGYVTTNGRFTSDPTSKPPSAGTGVWHEELATDLGIAAATPSSSGGSNWAYGAAVTGAGTQDLGIVHNVGRQVSDYLTRTSNICSPTALYAVFAGGNDLLDAADADGTNTVGVHSLESAANTAANNLETYILNFATDGARYLVWPNLPELDQTPYARSTYNSSIEAALADAVQTFNSDVASAIQYIHSVNANVTIYAPDVHTWFNEMLNGTYPGYAFTNVTVPATSVTPVPASADTYLFWDKLHPTEKAHKLLGDAVFNTIAVGPLVVAAANWTSAGLTLKIGSDSKLHVYVTGTTTDAVTPSAPVYVTSVQITGPGSGSGNLTIDSSAGNPIPGGGLIETGSGIVNLLGSNTYKDATTVTSGKLIVKTPAALADGSNLTVGASAAQMLGSAPIVAAPTISSAASATASSSATSAPAKEPEVHSAPAATFPGAGAGQSTSALLRGAWAREKAILDFLALVPSARKAALPENWAGASDSDSRQSQKTLAIQALDEILADNARQV